MMHRQATIRGPVRNLDLEHTIAGLRDRLEEVGRQIERADRSLDRALPQGHEAHTDEILRRPDDRLCRCRERGRLMERPQQGMRIEQDSHGQSTMPRSRAISSGQTSKSSAIRNCP
jgi:hypothetical protein